MKKLFIVLLMFTISMSITAQQCEIKLYYYHGSYEMLGDSLHYCYHPLNFTVLPNTYDTYQWFVNGEPVSNEEVYMQEYGIDGSYILSINVTSSSGQTYYDQVYIDVDNWVEPVNFVLSTDSLTGYNRISWDVPTYLTEHVDVFFYRSLSDPIQWTSMGYRPFRYGSWTDGEENDENNPFIYCMRVTDSCWNYSDTTDWITSIALCSGPRPGGGWRLKWSLTQHSNKSGSENIHIYSIPGVSNWTLNEWDILPASTGSYNLRPHEDSLFVVGLSLNSKDGEVEIVSYSNIIDNPDIQTVGIGENGLSFRPLQVFPNPSSGSVYILANGTVEIYNSIGQMVKKKNISGSESLPPGIYLIKHLETNFVERVVVYY